MALLNFKNLLFPPKPIYFYKCFEVPALEPQASIEYDRENTLRHFRKFMPFTNMQIVNTSDCEMEMILDYSQAKKLIILAGGTKALRNQPFSSWILKNNDDTLSTEAGQVIVELETIR